MDKKCWLHIGAPKTGSTAIQQFLATNEEVLAKWGYAYPMAARRSNGHHDLAFLAGGGYPDWATPQPESLDTLVSQLQAEIADGPSSLILSSENFYLLCDPQAALGFISCLGFSCEETVIIVYVRRQDEAHASWYNQTVKAQAYAGSLTEQIADSWDLWDYAGKLDAWAEAFGHDNLRVRPYQPQDLPGNDVRLDLLTILGLPQEAFHFPVERINTDINRDILEFQRQLNLLPLSPQDKRRFHKELIALTAAAKGSDLFDDSPLLSHSQRLEILATYSKGNYHVAKTYLAREQLFTAPESGAGGNEHAGLTVEKLASIVGWLLLAQGRGT